MDNKIAGVRDSARIHCRARGVGGGGFWIAFTGAMLEIDRMHTTHHSLNTTRIALCAFAVCTFLASAHAESTAPPQDADPDARFALQHHAAVDARYAERLEHHADEPHMRVRRGLLADRKAGFVEIDAEASGLPPHDPVEFIVISESSGHDYESLAISHARPSEIHEAMRFIGMEPGQPYNPRALRYSPKGERVIITFHWEDDDGATHAYRAEEMVRDDRTESHLVMEGFVFVGSQWLDEDGDRVYAADAYGPQSIVSIYNEPTTVFDVPRDVPQRDVYGFLRPYPDRQASYGRLLRIRIEPESRDGQRRVAEVTLAIRPGAGETPIHLTLLDADDVPLHDGHALHQVLSALNRIAEEGQTPFLSLDLHDDTPLKEIRDLLNLLRAFQAEGELHIEPPQPGDLFYRAFLPVEEHRERENRPSQALELHLTRSEDGLTGRVVLIEDDRRRREEPFDPVITEYAAPTPAALSETLADIQHRLPVLLVFAPGDMTYGTVMQWVRPVLDSHPMIHLFL